MELNKGMTLIEIMVAVGIFGMVMILLSATFLRGIERQKTSIETQNVLDNVRYLIEVMAREMRMVRRDRDGICLGVDFLRYTFCLADGTHNCISSLTEEFKFGERIKFLNYKGECVEYYKDGGVLKKKVGGAIQTISARNVKMNSIIFGIRGESAYDSFQPRVLILIDTEGQRGDPASRIKTQTTISSRELDTP